MIYQVCTVRYQNLSKATDRCFSHSYSVLLRDPMGRMRQALWNREFPSKAHAVGWPGATLGATLPEIVAWLLRLAPQSNRKDSDNWIRVTLYLLCKMDKREKRKAQTFPFGVGGSAHACSAGNALATMQTSKSILSPKLASTRPRSGDRDETRSAPFGNLFDSQAFEDLTAPIQPTSCTFPSFDSFEC